MLLIAEHLPLNILILKFSFRIILIQFTWSMQKQVQERVRIITEIWSIVFAVFLQRYFVNTGLCSAAGQCRADVAEVDKAFARVGWMPSFLKIIFLSGHVGLSCGDVYQSSELIYQPQVGLDASMLQFRIYTNLFYHWYLSNTATVILAQHKASKCFVLSDNCTVSHQY